ncbi:MULTISPECIES: hypothetical protein [unclassified Caulobacter]|jgi:hypothetical protein|uniref:hypothetical protein n=1 Tax=unclassified Caulobacter TaxID=2648921 RepID=UPI0007001B21|nr:MULTISPECIES: hypothetical protein [unclassified Caulobacter]KQV58159.1 hypothetical protein ASC62_04965 [Caulobacter sp. Root342]KQV69336.1 hypothetical protein ASC70_11070 [Caulobacter sp. Root343]
MKTLAHDGRHSGRHDSERGGVWAALLVVLVLAAAVWGAWKLGVMAGDRVDLRQRLTDMPALRKGPNPQPAPVPISRRPGVEAEARR